MQITPRPTPGFPLIAGPLLGLGIAWGLPFATQVEPPAGITAGIAVWMAVWWMTEAVPLAATALLPMVTFPFLGIYPVDWKAGDEALVSATQWDDTLGGEGSDLRRVELLEPVEPSSWRVRPIKSQVSHEVPETSLVSLRPQLKPALTPYADKFVFLFLGGFLIAEAVQKWGLHRRIALNLLLAVGTSPARLVAGFMVTTAGMSMWLSNTATTIVMLPVAMSLVSQFRKEQADHEGQRHVPDAFAVCLMLAIAYAATIGGIATLIGTPPNALLATQLEKLSTPIPFATWMVAAVPLSIVLLLVCWWLLTRVLFPLGDVRLTGGRAFLEQARRDLGPMTRPEWTVCFVFGTVAFLWIFRTPLGLWDGLVVRLPIIARLDDSMIAMAGALVLFAIPVRWNPLEMALTWKEAQRISWEILLLFGGGLSLSQAISASGLGLWLGQTVTGWNVGSQWVVVAVVVLTILFLTEFTSNLATAALFLPLLASIAPQLPGDIAPATLMIPAALAASCAFMLPVATPPNAIVFGSGQLRIQQMIRAGIWLNLLSAMLIVFWTLTWGRWVLGF